MPKTKIIVTGAAGMVGQNLIPLLVKRRYKVVAIDKNSKNLGLLTKLTPKITGIEADLAKNGKWEKYFKGAATVIQLQAQVAGGESSFKKNNVASVKRVIGVCRKNKVKHLIHLSSSVVISIAKDDYTRTKRKGEELVKKSKVPHTILRPPLMYGCFDVKHLGKIMLLMEKFPIIPVFGDGKYIRQPLYVNDLCQIILAIVKREPENKLYDVIGLEKIAYIDLLKKIVKIRKMKRFFVKIPLPIFGAMLKIYEAASGKIVFTEDQMTAFANGDIFPVTNWEKIFKVKYTPFNVGIKKTWRSPCAKYLYQMASPH